jgi:hypothetical protein
MNLRLEHKTKRIEDLQIDTTDNLYQVGKDYFVETVRQNDYPSGRYTASFGDESVEFEVKEG